MAIEFNLLPGSDRPPSERVRLKKMLREAGMLGPPTPEEEIAELKIELEEMRLEVIRQAEGWADCLLVVKALGEENSELKVKLADAIADRAQFEP